MRTVFPVLFAAVLGALPWSAAVPSVAQAEAELGAAEPEDGSAYRSLVGQAVVEMDAGRYAEARALFTEAHRLAPNARTLRGLGIVAFELGDYVSCLAYVDAAVASPRRPLTITQRDELSAVRARAQAFVGYVAVEVVPTRAELWVDGRAVPPAARARLPLVVGEHAFEARALGYMPSIRTLHVDAGPRSVLRVALQPTHADALAGPPAAAEASHAVRPWYRNPWFWVGTAAVVVAGASVGGVLLSRGSEPSAAPIRSANTPPDGVLDGARGR